MERVKIIGIDHRKAVGQCSVNCIGAEDDCWNAWGCEGEGLQLQLSLWRREQLRKLLFW